MGKSQRTKGADGEREVVNLLKSYGFESQRTAPMQAGGTGFGDVSGLPGYYVEVKRQERWRVQAWYDQADKAAYIDEIPLVLMRSSRKDWLVVMDARDFLDVITGEKP